MKKRMSLILTSLVLMSLLFLPMYPVIHAQVQVDNKIIIPKEKLATLKPFAVVPFKAGTKWTVGEGFRYFDEVPITGETDHDGADLDTNEGVKLYAPCSGKATVTFQTRQVKNSDGSPRMYQGKPVFSGAGFVIQIRCTEQPLLAMMMHMSKYKADLYAAPDKDGNGFYRPSPILKPMDDPTFGMGNVNVGDEVGEVGVSGLGNFQEDPNHIAHKYNGTTWDDPHVHLWFGERGAKGGRSVNLDPFGWYGTTQEYPQYRLQQQHPEYGLFLTYPSGRQKGQLRYARQ